MKTNPVIETLLAHRSIRKYKEDVPSDEDVETIVRAGQQAPFASQLYSILLSRNRAKNPWKAPLLFTICVDSFKFESIMAMRNWKMASNDLSLLFFGIQDASLMAENMVAAARSLGLGTCFLGSAPYRADKIAEEYKLPKRVFPLVQLAMGFPAEAPPTRPRYPMEFVLFEDSYPEFDPRILSDASKQMDEGYLSQDYYRAAKYMIPLDGGRKETFTYETYSWTEHISRKWGQWYRDPSELMEQLEKRGFHVTRKKEM
jgi:nitroreductase